MGYAQVAGVEDSIRRGEGGQEKIKAALLAAHGGDDEGFLQGIPVTALGGLSVRAWRKFITKLKGERGGMTVQAFLKALGARIGLKVDAVSPPPAERLKSPVKSSPTKGKTTKAPCLKKNFLRHS